MTNEELINALRADKVLNETLRQAADAIGRLTRNLRDCRNELCLMCGNYKSRGACGGCRWRADNGN